MPHSTVTRRRFLAAGAASGAATLSAAAYARVLGANERISVGFIGYGLIGKRHVLDFQQQPDVRLAAVAETHRGRLAEALSLVGDQAQGHGDFRRLLDGRQIDAVVVSTPDHWHAPMTMLACAAGKDVYVEKPLTLFVQEGRWMIDVARRHKRVVQVGTQQRSGKHYQRARELLQGGAIGKVVSVRMQSARNIMPGFGSPPDGDPPPELDWEMWLGPAPRVRYNPNRGIYHFRWFWDYSGGQMTNLGAHSLDIVDWTLGLDKLRAVTSAGGRFCLRDNGETPDTQDAIFEFDDWTATWSLREGSRGGTSGYGLEFFGTKGCLGISRSGFTITGDPDILAVNQIPQFADHPVGGPESITVSGPRRQRTESLEDKSGDGRAQFRDHVRDFLDCIRSRGQPISDLESAHRVSVACHLANLSLRLGRKMRWDAAKETIVDDTEAREQLVRPYRAPWDRELKAVLALLLWLALGAAALWRTSLIQAADIPKPVTGFDTPLVDREVSLTAEEMPLKDALALVCKAAGVELDLDSEGLRHSGVSVEAPVTLTLTREPLRWALAQVVHKLRHAGVFWRAEGARISISTLAAEEERTRRALPDWLKPLHNNGLLAAVDQQQNVIGVMVGEKADDALLARLKLLPQLRRLEIEGSKGITPAGLAQLTELPALETLSLSDVYSEGNSLGDAALGVAAGLMSLRDLSVRECGVTDDGLRSLEQMPGLVRLSLSGNRLTDAGMKSLAGLTKLRSLSLSLFQPPGFGRTRISDEGLRHLEGLTELEELSLNYLSVTGRYLPFPKLKSLTLSGYSVDDGAMPQIAGCSELRSLGLLHTQVSDEGLAHVATLKELRRFSLSSNFITDQGIARIKDLPTLEHLELRAAGLTDETLTYVSQIKTLRRLDLYGGILPGPQRGRIFTMAGLQALKGLPNLRELWLTNFGATGDFLMLRELTQLRGLVFAMTDISEWEVEALQEAMPATRIGGTPWRR